MFASNGSCPLLAWTMRNEHYKISVICRLGARRGRAPFRDGEIDEAPEPTNNRRTLLDRHPGGQHVRGPYGRFPPPHPPPRPHPRPPPPPARFPRALPCPPAAPR